MGKKTYIVVATGRYGFEARSLITKLKHVTFSAD